MFIKGKRCVAGGSGSRSEAIQKGAEAFGGTRKRAIQCVVERRVI